MFGSPGIWDYKGSLLARHGYVTLALGFHGKALEEIHPRNKITSLPALTMSYIHKAIDFLRNHPKVDTSCGGVGVVSMSGSVSVSLLMSVHSRHIKCVVCSNGPISNFMGDFICEDKTYPPINNHNGEGITLHKYDSSEKPGVVMRTMRWFFETLSPTGETDPPQARIPFQEQKDVGFLYIAGLSDQNVPSEYFANVFERQLKAVGHPNFKVVRYPGAGHFIEPPYEPHSFMIFFPYFRRNFVYGGKTKAHYKAQVSAWTETLQFLRNNLS